MGALDKLKHAWNAFTDTPPIQTAEGAIVSAYGSFGGRPDRVRYSASTERSIIASIYTRLAIDAANVNIKHVRVDDQDRYIEDIKSGLNDCLTVEANIDQAARSFRQDLFMTMLEHGFAVVVPVDTTLDPTVTGSFDVKTMRIGEIVQWMPKHVKVRLYNENTGRREDIVLEKRSVSIVDNPLYSVMNEPNSTLQRLIRKLNILDAIDEQSGSGKLDLIIQLPYVIKSEARREQAEQRRKDIEFQLKGSKYGIAYTDGTERITQLNRPTENNLLSQVEYLTKMLYAQLGLTEEVMNGVADEKAMINYYARTIDPILTATVEALRRSLLTKTARTQGQTIKYFRDPFKLVPISEIADIADKFSRNEITSANDIRTAIGMVPSTDERANKLINSNMPTPPSESVSPVKQEGSSQNGT